MQIQKDLLMLRSLMLVLIATWCAAEGLPQPAALPDAQVFAVVVVPKPTETLRRCEQIAELFAPGMFKPGAFAELIGKRIDDPGLGKLAAGPVVVVVGPGGMAPSVALLIPSAEPDLHATAIRRLGAQVEIADGMLVVGSKAADVALGQRLATSYASLAEMAIDGDMRVLVAPSRILTAYRPVLGGLIQVLSGQMAKQPDGQRLAAIVGLEIQALLMITDDISAVQIDVDLANHVVSTHTLLAAVPDSKLAAALVAPLPATTPAPALRLGNEPGYMQCTARFNGEALYAWMGNILRDLQKKPEGATLISDDLIAMTRDLSSVINGGIAMRMRARDGAPMCIEGAFDCQDGAKLSQFYERMLSAMFGDTAIGQMYAAMGINATLEHDVRKIGGFPVHRIHYVFAADKMPAGQADHMISMMRDCEYTVIPGIALLAQHQASLDRMVQGDAGEMTTHAAKTLDQGHDGYVDIDYLGMMKAVFANNPVMQGQPFAAALTAMPTSEPTGLAWSAAAGRVSVDTRVPLKPFADLAAAFRHARNEPAAVGQPVF